MAFPIPKVFSFGLEVNRNAESSKEACRHLFSQAKDSIVILSGELNEEFYGDSRICGTITSAAKGGVPVEVAYGPQPSNRILTALQNLAKKYDNVKLYPLPERPERHFMVVDGKTVRIQLEHLPGNKEHRAVIKRNSPELAVTFLNYFADTVGKRASEPK